MYWILSINKKLTDGRSYAYDIYDIYDIYLGFQQPNPLRKIVSFAR